jgi:predicted metal-binding membrane protein
MAIAQADPLARERRVILAALFVLAAAAWVLLYWQSLGPPGAMMGPTMGLTPAVFLAIWVAMMIAMMFPTAAPMILAFHRIHAQRKERGQAFVPTWVFVAAYLFLWTLFGALAYVAATVAERLAMESPLVAEQASRVGGGCLVLAGLYQLSPWKRVCLAKCRTPLDFILDSWRDGYWGTIRMGLEHGAYCLGCCWLLFVILFPLGVMNLAAMAVLTLLIFAEKSLPPGVLIGRIAALVFVGYGVLVLFVPSALPTFMPMPENMPMPDNMPMPGSAPMPGM